MPYKLCSGKVSVRLECQKKTGADYLDSHKRYWNVCIYFSCSAIHVYHLVERPNSHSTPSFFQLYMSRQPQINHCSQVLIAKLDILHYWDLCQHCFTDMLRSLATQHDHKKNKHIRSEFVSTYLVHLTCNFTQQERGVCMYGSKVTRSGGSISQGPFL